MTNSSRSGRRDRYDSESESSYDSRSPPRRERRKSLGEKAMELITGGTAAGAAAGASNRRARSQSRGGGRRRRDYSDESDYDDRRGDDQSKRMQQALKSAVTAGAIEAFRSRKEPGGLAGSGKRVLTAAIAAAGVDSAADRDPNKHGTRHTIEAVVGGLAGNRLINGARSRSRSRGARGSGRGAQKDGGLGGVGALAATGLAALAAKKISDNRSKSRDRDEDRRGRGRRDYYSNESRSPSPKRSRSKSVSAYVSRGLGKLGLKDDKRGGKDDYYSPRPRGGGKSSSSSSSSSANSSDYSSEEESKKIKKMRTKEFVTAGLASVATIHAAHSIYQAKEKREKHRKQYQEGKISAEEVKRLKTRGRLQEAAAVGIAALGIKGAMSEWKETREMQHECKEANEKFESKRQRRREKIARGEWVPPDQRGRSQSAGPRKRISAPEMSGGRYSDASSYAVAPPPIGGGGDYY